MIIIIIIIYITLQGTNLKLPDDDLEMSEHVGVYIIYRGADKSLARTGKETSSETCQGCARFQQHRDARCEVPFPAKQGDEGNSRHSDSNIRLFPSLSG